MHTQVIKEACTRVLLVRLELDIVMFTVYSNQLTTPECIDDTLGFRGAQELNSKLIDSHLESGRRRSSVSILFDVPVSSRHHAGDFVEGQSMDLEETSEDKSQ